MPSIADILAGGRRKPALPAPRDESTLQGWDYADDFDETLKRLDANPDSVIHDAPVPDYVGDIKREEAARAARPMSEKLGALGKEAWQFATGRHEIQRGAGEYIAEPLKALARQKSNQGDVGGAQLAGFLEGASEAVPRVVNPTTVAGLAVGGAPAAAAALPRAALAVNEGLQLSDAIASAKESSDAYGQGDTGMGAAGLAMSTVAAIASALGLKGLMAPRVPHAGAPRAVRPPSVSVEGEPFRAAGPAGRTRGPAPAAPGLPEHILDAELIHDAGPSSLERPRQLPPPGARPGDGGPIVPEAPPGSVRDPLADYFEGLPAAGEMPPGVPRPQEPSRIAEALSPGPAPDRASVNVSRGVGGPLAPGLKDAMAPPPGQQRVRLPRPVDVGGAKIREFTVTGDKVLLHPADGTEAIAVPRAVAEQMGLPVPPAAAGRLRGSLDALEAQRGAGATAPDDLSRDLGISREMPAQAPSPGQADPLAELQRMFSGEPETPAAREWQPPAAGGPGLELLDEGALGNNASGESGASMEAMSRLQGMKAKGQQFVVLDRGGNARPLIGADAVDYKPARGETHAIRNADGTFEVITDNGGRVPAIGRSTNQVGSPAEAPPAQREIARPQEQALAPAAGGEGLHEDAITHAMRELGLAGEGMPPEKLVHQAFVDPQTGLPNRQGLEHLEQRGGGNNLFAAMDVRNLKAVNDILGQHRGDELIKHIGEELGRTLRKGDVPSRFGGDEFMMMLQGVGEEGRPVVQQKLMQAVDRALEKFGTRQAGDFPLGARMAFGADRDSALAEMTRQKGMEKGAKYRPMNGQGGELPAAPANPVPGVRYEMPAEAIGVDPQRFQYRRNVDKSGIDPERALSGKYDPARGGVIGVWKDPETGQTIVVNGHHRLKLAQEQGAKVAAVYLDAPNAQAARAEGALINMSEGNSSMGDAVNFLRDTGHGVDALREYGITSRSTIGRDAPAIASLSDPVRAQWEAGDLDDGLAATIGHAKLQPEQQAAVTQLVTRQKDAGRSVTPAVLKNVIEQVKRADTVNMAGQGAQSNIFDVLGEDQFASSAIQRAELTDFVRTSLAKDKRLFGFVSKGDRASKIEGAGAGSIDKARAGELAGDAGKVGAVFDQLEQARGPISDALNDAARRIMQGENANAVRQELLGAVRVGVETELRNPVPQPAAAGESTPVPRGREEAPQVPKVGADSGAETGRALVEPRAAEVDQPRLPGDVGAVRDVEQPPAKFEAPYALRGEAAPEPLAETQKLLGIDDVELPPARPRDEPLFGHESEPGPATLKVRERQAMAPADVNSAIEGFTKGQSTYDALPSNKRDFLTKRLKYSRDDIDAMTPVEADRIGRDQTFNPKLTERTADATARYDRTLDELAQTFEEQQPGKIRGAAANRRAAQRGGVPTPEEQQAMAQRQAPMREGAERELAAGRETPPEEKRAATPSEMKGKQDVMAHRARDIHRAMEGGDYDEAARLIGEQAEDWNTQRLKAGTKEENKVPGRHRSGEYLASDFGAMHQFLFTPEGRAKLGAFVKDMAKNPAVRGLVGGVAGAYTGDTVDEQFQRGLMGMVAAAGTPGGLKVLGQAFEHYRRTGNIMRKSPTVPNADIGVWRGFVAPTSIERTVPQLFAKARDVVRDLQEYRTSNPKLTAEQHGAAEKIARGEIVSLFRQDAERAFANKQANLGKRIEMTADQMAGKLTAGQKLVKDTLQHTKIKPNATGREVEHITSKAIYRVTLGYALDSAAKNLFQPTLALLHVSPRNMVRALRAARTPQAEKLFNSLELELRRPVETGDDLSDLMGLSRGGRSSDSGRFMRATDNWNRKWVFFGALAEQGELDNALAGKASPKAVEEAERVMRMTQGESGPMSSAPMFRGPVGGTLKPFMKYPNLAIENILDAFQGQAKYPKTAVLTMLGLGLTGAAFGLDLSDILIGGARPLGLDPFHPRRMQLPPAANAVAGAAKYVSGEKRVFGDLIPTSPSEVIDSDAAYLLAGRYPQKVAKTLRGLGSSDDPMSDLASLVGLTTRDKAETRDAHQSAYEFMTEKRQQSQSEGRRVRGRLERAIKGHDTDEIGELERMLTPSQVKGVERKIERGDLESIRLQVPLKDREEFDRRFGADMAREKERRGNR